MQRTCNMFDTSTRIRHEVEDCIRWGVRVYQCEHEQSTLWVTVMLTAKDAAIFKLTFGGRYPLEPPFVVCENVQSPRLMHPDIEKLNKSMARGQGFDPTMNLLEIYQELEAWARRSDPSVFSQSVEIRVDHDTFTFVASDPWPPVVGTETTAHATSNKTEAQTNSFALLFEDDDEAEESSDEASEPSILPRDVLATVATFLSESSKAVLASSSRTNRSEAPAFIEPDGQQEWVVQNNRMKRQVCNVLGETDPDVPLGVLLNVEYHPKTRMLSAVRPAPGYWSYKGMTWTRSVDGSYRRMTWLPLNARRDRKALEWVIPRLICRNAKDTPFDAVTIPEVMARILHSFVLILADKVDMGSGSYGDDDLLDQYAVVTQLAQDLLKQYRLNNAGVVQDLHKSHVPDLGTFCVKMTMLQQFGEYTEDILRQYLARCVLWWGGKDERYALESGMTSDPDAREHMFDASRVGTRMLLLCRAMGSCIRPTRKCGGRCSLNDKIAFRKMLHRIYSIASFEEFIQEWREGAPAGDTGTLLARAVVDSETAGYHSATTDFAKIANIKGSRLLRGESRSIPIRKIRIKMQASTGILCCAVHPYDETGRLGTVCYNKKQWGGTTIVHSGDKRTSDQTRTVHEVDIDLTNAAEIGANEIFMTLSSCGAHTFANLGSVDMSIENQDGASLVDYSLDGDVSTCRSVVMARLVCDQQQRWCIQALGTTSNERCCGNYKTIWGLIDQLRQRRMDRT